jgi:hypothetical protein
MATSKQCAVVKACDGNARPLFGDQADASLAAAIIRKPCNALGREEDSSRGMCIARLWSSRFVMDELVRKELGWGWLQVCCWPSRSQYLRFTPVGLTESELWLGGVLSSDPTRGFEFEVLLICILMYPQSRCAVRPSRRAW